MREVIEKGCAEEVQDGELATNDGKVWYIPHHGVYHPKKPDKIRVVFDCSATLLGESLKRHLLPGRDLTNGLVGVLCRFREEPVAFMCDLEAMFHQLKVDQNHRNFLRFLWWPNGDIKSSPTEYRMTVHLFGAGSSLGCANYALKTIATDYEEEFGFDAANFIRNNFYVDNGLKSVPTAREAIALIENTKKLCKKGGLRLHKFTSNSKEVLGSIPVDDRAKCLKDLDLQHCTLPVERALGVQWCVETDTFEFRIILQDKPMTRRGILSTVSSVYDPLGFLSPFTLIGKQILQQLCCDKAEWNDQVPDELRMKWDKWRTDLLHLEQLKIPRCSIPDGFGNIRSVELHHFSDASVSGYGQCSYLRLVDDRKQVHCSFAMGKARVTPLKTVMMPRLELIAALVSVNVGSTLRRELDYEKVAEVFLTDSQVVLGYIKNNAKRFHVFVAYRVQQIRENSTPEQWRYISSEENPADEASRGSSPNVLTHSSRWIMGPSFLWDCEVFSGHGEDNNFPILPDDPEVRRTQLFTTGVQGKGMTSILERLEYFSDWHLAKKAVAVSLRYKARL